MHRLAWDKSLTADNCPKIYSENPLSPYNWPRDPMPLETLKVKGLVQSSCVPQSILENLQFPLLNCYKDSDEIALKLTDTGVTFLGKFIDQEGKPKKSFEQTGRFRKRYSGAKTCAIDYHGRLWLDASELEFHAKGPKSTHKKKTSGSPTEGQNIIFETSSTEPCVPCGAEPDAISQIIDNCENFATNVAKKDRKKSYKVDKVKVRSRVLTYLNTQKGKKHLYFWTVSFPAHTPDDVCYQAFNTWLTKLRHYKMLKDYTWVAERQTGDRLKENKEPTNTIHFHIAVPHYMNAQRANAMMRGTLKNLAKKGLIPGAVCSKGGENYFLPCIAKYNGVDIAKHRKTGRVINFAIKKGSVALANYLTKYVTKNDSEFPHLAWHGSRGYSALFTGITVTLNEFTKAGFGGYLNKIRVFEMNFATFIPWLFGPPKAFTDHLYELNSTIQNLLEYG